jgi:hypothetical protein
VANGEAQVSLPNRKLEVLILIGGGAVLVGMALPVHFKLVALLAARGYLLHPLDHVWIFGAACLGCLAVLVLLYLSGLLVGMMLALFDRLIRARK